MWGIQLEAPGAGMMFRKKKRYSDLPELKVSTWTVTRSVFCVYGMDWLHLPQYWAYHPYLVYMN